MVELADGETIHALKRVADQLKILVLDGEGRGHVRYISQALVAT